MEKYLTLSVHQLVDFLLRTGDIDNRVFNRSSMQEGSRLHAVYQNKQGSDYISEYPLKRDFTVDEVTVTLEGRADGIIKRKNGDFIIDEIKTTVVPLEEFKQENLAWHLGQAKCYALMFALEQNLDHIGVRLTYIRQGHEKEKNIEEFPFFTAELKQYVYSLLEDYLAFYNIIFRAQENRNATIANLEFPFPKYRRGQRELAKYSFAIAKNGGRFYCEAPTGIGKTMSTLYPFIKAMSLDEKSKIFYLTAKTSGKESAYHAINLLKEKGLIINDIVITAKDKICFSKGKACNPDECPFTKAYYNKIQSVLRYSLLHYDTFDYQTIINIAHENEICPFELELDLSLFSDVIICDYNYMFDPLSYMKRYFDDDSSHYLALIDEAHNLVDRSRDMYSASISYKKYLEAKKSIRHSKHAKLKRAQAKLNKMFKDLSISLEEGENIVDDFSDEIYQTLNYFLTTCQDINKNEHKEMSKELLEFYLDVNRFLKIAEFYNENYLAYIVKRKEQIELKLLCLDASKFLASTLNRIKGSVLFSATLQPIDYFLNTLGGDRAIDPTLLLPSPFPMENLKLMVAPNVSIKFKNREKTYQEVASYISSFIKNKIGNYFIYCPSYEYLDNLMNYIDLSDVDIYKQKKDMDDLQKEEFLSYFQRNPQKTTLGFLVIGGSFSEGIDLVSDRLIGAIVIGIGMPKINFESDQIANFYKNKKLPGHDYAYVNPGMNKVMQAVGRVIRSEEDKGAVLLIDERYMSKQYQDLYRYEWKNYEVVFFPKEVEENLNNFFKK